MYPYTARYPSHRRGALWLGMAMCISALIGASFATDVNHLIHLDHNSVNSEVVG